jgi:GLPGLI family protein
MKLSFLALCLSLTLSALSQNINGVATYKTASSLPFDMKNSEASQEQQDMIKQMMIKAMQKEYTLSFNRSESLYKEVEKLEQGGGRMAGFMNMFGGASGLMYKNLTEQSFAEQKEFFSKQFLIEDSLTDYNWKIGKETKSIGKYSCYKATAQKVFTRMTISRNKAGESKDSTFKDTVNLTAWFSMQIPVSTGPAKYGGLPGLIMELNDGTTTMVCTKVVLNPSEPVEIKKPDSGEEVNQKEYDEIAFKKIKEMQKMYGGGQGRGGGRGRGSMTITIGD